MFSKCRPFSWGLMVCIECAVFKHNLVFCIMNIFCEFAVRWMPNELVDDKSMLVPAMAICHKAMNRYPNQCSPTSTMVYMVSLDCNEAHVCIKTRACFLSLARSKLRLCSANHRAGYFKKMHVKMLSAKWRPFCLGLNVLIVLQMRVYTTIHSSGTGFTLMLKYFF